MCNAWNHAPGCNCGWGDSWYGSKPAHRARAYFTFESFVNPRSRCPICDASVYFYQSPEGGKVYFDELGPPWPKHPCTDTGVGSTQITKPSTTTTAPTRPRWQVEGWSPFLVASVVDYSPNLWRINGALGDESVELFILKSGMPSQIDTREFIELAAIQCKAGRPGQFRMSILGPTLRPIEVVVYVSSLDADSPLSGSRPSPMPRRVRDYGRRP